MKILGFVGLVLAVAAMRFIPHPTNFTPLIAVALFAGAKSPSRWMAYVLPVAALWLGDLFIGTHHLMNIVALSLVLSTLIGHITENLRVRDGSRIVVWGASGFLASAAFFFLTNFAVWLTSNLYPLTTEGLITCFEMALPFFSNQLLSTWLFSGVLFGLWRVAEPFLQEARSTN